MVPFWWLEVLVPGKPGTLSAKKCPKDLGCPGALRLRVSSSQRQLQVPVWARNAELGERKSQRPALALPQQKNQWPQLRQLGLVAARTPLQKVDHTFCVGLVRKPNLISTKK